MNDDVPVDVDLARVWERVAGDVWARPVGRLEQSLGRLLGSRGLARAVVTTPSLVASWLLASVMVMAVGVLVTAQTGAPWVALLTPALAGVGVAFAYGPGVDPAWELGRSVAISDRMVLLARVAAVFVANALLGLAATVVVGEALTLVLHWLAPMAMLSALGLAVASATRSASVGAAVVLAGWATIVVGGSVSIGGMAAVEETALLPTYAAAAVVLAVVALVMTEKRAPGW